MAKTDNYSQYACDRCGAVAYLPANSVEIGKWHKITYVDSNEVSQQPLLCASCYSSYKTLVASHDSDYSKFMANESEA